LETFDYSGFNIAKRFLACDNCSNRLQYMSDIYLCTWHGSSSRATWKAWAYRNLRTTGLDSYPDTIDLSGCREVGRLNARSIARRLLSVHW